MLGLGDAQLGAIAFESNVESLDVLGVLNPSAATIFWGLSSPDPAGVKKRADYRIIAAIEDPVFVVNLPLQTRDPAAGRNAPAAAGRALVRNVLVTGG